MALQIRQTLRQTQQLVMTPQLQQAIKLLQYNHLEMVEAVEQEIKENPLLEVTAEDEPLNDKDSETRNDLESLEKLVEESPEPEKGMLDIDWENYLEAYGQDYVPVNRDSEDRPRAEDLLTYNENLFNYLVKQLQLSRIEGDDRWIAFQIAGNLNERGFLDFELSELAEAAQTDVEHVEQVLKKVQEFDPPGVAARDLRECLLIQAKQLDPKNELVEKILEETFEAFQVGKLDVVARKLKVSTEDIQEASRVIAKLDPSPGRVFLDTGNIYVIPDIYIIKVGNDYSVILNDDGVPRLRISSFYQQQLHGGDAAAGAKDYIQDKMRGAMWLIKSIHQRQRTIYKVAQSILKFQREFFDKGIDYLKPLILRDVADDIEMHESTISRVTSNKYMHTPRGIFELKYFFNTGIGEGADSVASESVKNHIARIIKNEDTKKPASDKQIVELLARSGIKLARRTVAKYREMMGIPPSSKRKKKF
jgi:RNA polymerase sigma-54 factor